LPLCSHLTVVVVVVVAIAAQEMVLRIVGDRCLAHGRPPLRQAVIPEGGASMGVAPAGAAYARRHRPCWCQPRMRAVVPVGRSLGRGRLCLLMITLCGLAVGGHPSRSRPPL
ncbi:hypothetical protein B296_00008790, partial [Ensete ventricosum]